MGAENRVEDMGEDGNRSLGKVPQYPVRDTVRARSLADLQTLDGYVNLVRGGELWFAGRVYKVRPQRQVNHLNNCWDRRIGHRLKLSLQIVCKCFGLLGV